MEWGNFSLSFFERKKIKIWYTRCRQPFQIQRKNVIADHPFKKIITAKKCTKLLSVHSWDHCKANRNSMCWGRKGNTLKERLGDSWN